MPSSWGDLIMRSDKGQISCWFVRIFSLWIFYKSVERGTNVGVVLLFLLFFVTRKGEELEENVLSKSCRLLCLLQLCY